MNKFDTVVFRNIVAKCNKRTTPPPPNVSQYTSSNYFDKSFTYKYLWPVNVAHFTTVSSRVGTIDVANELPSPLTSLYQTNAIL
jgi:hypothetical protein